MKKNQSEEPVFPGSFRKFLLTRRNKDQLLILSALYLVLYVVLILLYPYPAGISDSGSYVRAAAENMQDTYRPFGYSRFLIIIHSLSPSIHFLVFIQYIINALSAIFLLFTVKYFYPPRRIFIFWIYAIAAVFSPLLIYLSNSVLSDSLFTSMTMLWLSTGLWMINQSKQGVKIASFGFHALLLFFLITVRFTGLAYLPVSVFFVILSFDRKKLRLSSSLVIILLIIVYSFYSYQKSKIFELVRVRTFSGFSGWQKASNALNCVPYININPSDIRDRKLKEFTRFVLQYDTLLVTDSRPSAKFMWDNRLPLKAWCINEAQRTNTPYIYQWNYLGAKLYGRFGSYIMKKYPFAFARYYLLPNCRLIFFPADDQVVKVFRTDWIPDTLLGSWFRFDKGEKLHSNSRLFQKIFILIPVARSLMWLLLLFSLVTFVVKRKTVKLSPARTRSFLALLAFVVVYYAFSAYAGPFELRYIGPVHLAIISLIYISLNEITFINRTGIKP